MNILIAPDSFKESLGALEAAQAIRRGFARVFPEASYTLLPMADGGEGTTAAMAAALDGQWVETAVEDPLGRTVNARYILFDGGTAAVMEMAEASGLQRLAADERRPSYTSSYGTGQMIADALQRGVRRIILGIGGSATNDGGAGMAAALGYRFLDADGRILPRGGAALSALAAVDADGVLPALGECRITAACDVRNPLLGAEGASAVFAPQKGADGREVAALERALAHYAAVLAAQGFADCADAAGSGAAGGLGYGLRVFCNAELRAGAQLIMESVGIERHLAQADLLLTGEGRMDGQTAFGKIPYALAQAAAAHGVPVIGIGGSIGTDAAALADRGFTAVFPSIPRPAALSEVLTGAAENIEYTAFQIARLWQAARCVPIR